MKPKHLNRAKEMPDNPRVRCTGGLKNEMGKRLTNCRSAACPQHTPDGYAKRAAKHARDMALAEWPR